MSIFIDTSAIFAVLDADDQNHEPARQTWVELITQEAVLVCTNYVLLETFALVQRRLGIKATRVLQEAIVPMLRVEWMTEAHHATGVAALLIRNLALLMIFNNQ